MNKCNPQEPGGLTRIIGHDQFWCSPVPYTPIMKINNLDLQWGRKELCI